MDDEWWFTEDENETCPSEKIIELGEEGAADIYLLRGSTENVLLCCDPCECFCMDQVFYGGEHWCCEYTNGDCDQSTLNNGKCALYGEEYSYHVDINTGQWVMTLAGKVVS
eukprot:SAG11_NODE_2398_length_3403_cov_245.251211_2_plen_111_part_00